MKFMWHRKKLEQLPDNKGENQRRACQGIESTGARADIYGVSTDINRAVKRSVGTSKNDHRELTKNPRYFGRTPEAVIDTEFQPVVHIS